LDKLIDNTIFGAGAEWGLKPSHFDFWPRTE